MAEQLKYNGDCSCSKPTIFGYGHECYYCSMNENSRHLHQKLMVISNTHIKWWNVVHETYCIHQWLYLMQCIFECDLDQQSAKYIVCYLTGDVTNVYEYQGHVTYMDAVLSAETAIYA